MEKNNQHILFITGGAGYVGAMLCEQFSEREDVIKIVALDKEPMPDQLKGNAKIVWIHANTSDGTWQERVRKEQPDVVIHTAWQIRELYGHQDIGWKWNVDGSDAIFNFAFTIPSVRKLIYFSTASIYGAYSTNTFSHHFTEDEPMLEEEYSYGREKKRVEENLRIAWENFRRKDKKNVPQVFIVRPAAITGPRGRFMRIRFGLQSALGGTFVCYPLKVHSTGLLTTFLPCLPPHSDLCPN
jgi:nucleoside-diphosphate-sugar epimerase